PKYQLVSKVLIVSEEDAAVEIVREPLCDVEVRQLFHGAHANMELLHQLSGASPGIEPLDDLEPHHPHLTPGPCLDDDVEQLAHLVDAHEGICLFAKRRTPCEVWILCCLEMSLGHRERVRVRVRPAKDPVVEVLCTDPLYPLL